MKPVSKLFDQISHSLFDKGFGHESSGNFRPSEGTAVIQTIYGPRVIGTCARAMYYRLTKTPPSNAEDFIPAQIMRMNIGKVIEIDLIERCKREGIFVDNNIRFDHQIKNFSITGELDIVARTEPGSDLKYVIECKTIANYPAKKKYLGAGAGIGKEPGQPKDSYLMQIAWYLYKFSNLPSSDIRYLPYGVIYICDRGDGDFGTYTVWLEKEYIVDSTGKESSKTSIMYYSNDLEVQVTKAPFTIEDMVDRLSWIKSCVDNEHLPTRDYSLIYNADEVEENFQLGNVSNTDYKSWQTSHGPRGHKKFNLGSWNCRPQYCQWSNLCWSKK